MQRSAWLDRRSEFAAGEDEKCYYDLEGHGRLGRSAFAAGRGGNVFL